MLTSITTGTNEYGSKSYGRMSWEEILGKMKKNPKTFGSLFILLLGSLSAVGTLAWKIDTLEPKEFSKLTEEDYFCDKIPEQEQEQEQEQVDFPEDDTRGSSSNGFHVQSRRRRS